MNTKLIVGLLVVIAGLGLGWYVLKGGSGGSMMKKTETTVAPSAGEVVVTSTIPPVPETSAGTEKGGVMTKVTVTLTDSGFSPKIITVKKGTTVTFVNGSSASMWVASDVHPTHQLLPGFDELTSVAKGGSYDYTFVKVGTWTYHNHLSPSDKGTVVVTE
ncbi:cupredoxin domain-containing protein [Candidatus Gottesmanbacteria bacterium]|nr:cupredoxin domain-containing protein [Candidatus Gottesmanbacteria bacterium]